MRALWQDPEFRKKRHAALNKTVQTKEHKERMSKISTECWKNPEYAEKVNRLATAAKNTPEYKERTSKEVTMRWSDPEFRLRTIKAMWSSCCRHPNKSEMKLEEILNRVLPNQYKYTGNGSFLVYGYSPDFVNCNGQKKVLELYGDYWHRNDDPKERINTFQSFGYDCLVIWERELKDEVHLEEKLLQFNEGVV